MYKLVVTELAHQDLDNIVSYIAIQLANPAAASDFLDKVDKWKREDYEIINCQIQAGSTASLLLLDRPCQSHRPCGWFVPHNSRNLVSIFSY
jgi:hypothetical protein